MLSSIQIDDSKNMILDGLTFDTSIDPIDQNKTFTMVLANANSHHIQVSNSVVKSADDSFTWTKEDWYANSVNGFRMIGDYMNLINNTILNLTNPLEIWIF